jgi:hypothetical protein
LSAWILINQTYPYFPKQLAGPSDEFITFWWSFGILASILGLWQAMKTQPAMALGGQ